MIQEVEGKREGKDQSEEHRSIRKLPIRSFHRSKNIAAGDECKVIALSVRRLGYAPIRLGIYPDVIHMPGKRGYRKVGPGTQVTGEPTNQELVCSQDVIVCEDAATFKRTAFCECQFYSMPEIAEGGYA